MVKTKDPVNKKEVTKKYKEARAVRIALRLEKAKERRIKKFKDADPMTVSGTTLKMMRKYDIGPKWKQVKGKDVRKKKK